MRERERSSKVTCAHLCGTDELTGRILNLWIRMRERERERSSKVTCAHLNGTDELTGRRLNLWIRMREREIK